MPSPATLAQTPKSQHRPPAAPPSPRSRTRRRLLAVTSLGLAGLLAGLLSGCGTGILPSTTASANLIRPGHRQLAVHLPRRSSLSPPVRRRRAHRLWHGSQCHPLPRCPQLLRPALHPAARHRHHRPSRPAHPLRHGRRRIPQALGHPLRRSPKPRLRLLHPHRRRLRLLRYRRNLNRLPPGPLAQRPVLPTDRPAVPARQRHLRRNPHHRRRPDLHSQLNPHPDLQPRTPDGVYHVTGTASSPGNPCVPSSLSATASAIDGGAISTTYTDPATGSTIAATGATSPDASTITISSWTINSPCGSDTGTGTLTRQ